MSYSNGVVLAPVGMGDISNAVGSSSLDIGTLVQATDTSVKWPKYKPMRGMNDLDVWQKRGDLYNGFPSKLGYMGVRLTTIGGVSAQVLTAFGMDIPMISSAASNIDKIISYTGATNWNWSKNSSFSWYWYRMLDFDGYKPSASFPIEYGSNNQEIDPAATSLWGGGRHLDAVQEDIYRLFIGDIGQFFNNKVVWGAVAQIKNSTNTQTYTSGIVYTNADGDVCYLHEVMPEHGQLYGYSDVFINLGSSLSNLGYSGGSGKVYTFGYIPPNSGTGYDGYAILLPSAGGADTSNPRSFTISSSSVTDNLAQLSFNLVAGVWGRTWSGASEIFLTGLPGYFLTDGTGLYAMGTAISLAFSVTFTNRSNNSVNLNLNRLAWDVSIASYGSSDYGQVKTSTRRSATYYRNGSSVSSLSLASGASATIYVVFSNLWEGLTASYYNNTGNYAVWMGIEIANLDNPTHHYSGGTTQLFAKYENPGTAWKFNWSWDGTGPKKV